MSGRVDVSDWMVYLPALLLFVMAVVALLHIPRLRFVRGLLAGAFGILLLLMASADVFFIRFAPRELGQRAWSPDGKHVAMLRYDLLGALGDDREVLVIRHAWSPFGEEVYLGARGNSDPHITWLGGHRLLLNIQNHVCGRQISSITIDCDSEDPSSH